VLRPAGNISRSANLNSATKEEVSATQQIFSDIEEDSSLMKAEATQLDTSAQEILEAAAAKVLAAEAVLQSVICFGGSSWSATGHAPCKNCTKCGTVTTECTTLSDAVCAIGCVATDNDSANGSDGKFYCVNGGDIGGVTGSCTCTSCNSGYSGDSCETVGAVSSSTSNDDDDAAIIGGTTTAVAVAVAAMACVGYYIYVSSHKPSKATGAAGTNGMSDSNGGSYRINVMSPHVL